MEAGTHSIWISEQLQELGHQVIVANVRELRAISHSDGKSDHADAEKLARFARLDPKILTSHRAPHRRTTGSTHVDPCTSPNGSASDGCSKCRPRTGEALRLSTAGFIDTILCEAEPGSHAATLAQSLGPVLEQIAEMTIKIKQYELQIKRLAETEYPYTLVPRVIPTA
jgi:hypothetical protein